MTTNMGDSFVRREECTRGDWEGANLGGGEVDSLQFTVDSFRRGNGRELTTEDTEDTEGTEEGEEGISPQR
jgi:hypothetical protein